MNRFALMLLATVLPIIATAAPPESPPLPATAQAGPPVELVGTLNLPGVPASVAKAAVDASRASAAALPTKERVLDEPIETNVSLTVKPGTTDLLRISRGYLNEFITPFDDPKIITVNKVEWAKEGSSLFITTSSEQPIAVHIRSNDPEDTRTIPLTLIPSKIPPKTVTLKWPEGTPGVHAPVSPAKAKRWEQSAPYEDKLYELATIVARGQIPDGYALSEEVEQMPCSLPEVEFFTGQRLTGSHFSVFVLKATNQGHSTVELLGHAGCGIPGVALVAPWPVAYLEPGHSTELLVAVVNDSYQPEPREQLRPSLLIN